MKHYYATQNNSFAACDEMRGNAATAYRSVEMKEMVVCPKPQRHGLVQATLGDLSYVRPPLMRWHTSKHQEAFDAKAGNELLDIILAKGGCGTDSSTVQLASSPPFFCGSPPSRVSNPLIQDARFGDPVPSPSPSAGLGPSKGGGFVRVNFGNNPSVRIEGFDCLDRDRRSIPALA